MREIRTLLLSLAIVGAPVAAAWAQSVPSDPPAAGSPTPPNVACAPGMRSQPPTVGSGGSGPTLSDQLAQSKGVICPPESLDKEMAVPPPETGHMRIIPPPGSPGGDPSVQPK